MIKISGAIIVCCICMQAFAETAEEKGLRIAIEADEFDSGFSDFMADMLMTLKNKNGQQSTRKIKSKTLEVEDDGDKSLSLFLEPADVKGTASLTYSHGLEPDDQWLYLPALKRVKRISSKNKSGPFMGSEFAFEDLGSQEVEKYSYKHLREESCGEFECHVIERFPAYKHSGYTRQTVWLDKQAYRAVRIEFYDRKNSLLKTLNSSGFQQYANRHWRPDRMEMVNHQTGKSTILEWTNYAFQTGLSENDFNKNSLKRLR